MRALRCVVGLLRESVRANFSQSNLFEIISPITEDRNEMLIPPYTPSDGPISHAVPHLRVFLFCGKRFKF